MIEKTDFPYTLGGYVEQQNYKGFDIAVSIRRYKGISAYVISSEKRLIREESATFADKFDVVTSGQRTNYFYYIVPKSLIKPDEVPDFAGLIYAYEGSVQCYSLEKGRYAVKRIFFEVVKPAQKVSDMKADDNFIRKLDLSMYYRYHQMRRDNYKNKE